MFQPMPADYPYEDNGFYEILDYTNGVYTVKRLNDSYGEISDWHGFYWVNHFFCVARDPDLCLQ